MPYVPGYSIRVREGSWGRPGSSSGGDPGAPLVVARRINGGGFGGGLPTIDWGSAPLVVGVLSTKGGGGDPPTPSGCQERPGCQCHTGQHCVPDWDGTGLPSLAWTAPNWGWGAHYALRYGEVWGLAEDVILAVMMWARDADLDTRRRPADGALIEGEFERLTGRSVDELDAAVDPRTQPWLIPGGGTRLTPPPRDPRPEQVTPEIVAYLEAPAAPTAAPAAPTAAPPPIRAGAGAPSWLLALLALPLAFAGYQEWEIRRKKTKKKR